MKEQREIILEKWVADLLVEKPELIKEMFTVQQFYSQLYEIWLQEIQTATKSLFRRLL